MVWPFSNRRERVIEHTDFLQFVCSDHYAGSNEPEPIPGSSWISRVVSQGGIAILTVADLTVGEVVELQFKLCQNALRLRAIIRKRKGARYGMEFLTLSPQQREHIVK